MSIGADALAVVGAAWAMLDVIAQTAAMLAIAPAAALLVFNFLLPLVARRRR